MSIQSKTKISLALSIINLLIAGIFFILLFTVFTKSEFWFVLIIVFFDFYIGNENSFGFSTLISIVIIFFSILGIIKEGEKRINVVCILVSIIYGACVTIYRLK